MEFQNTLNVLNEYGKLFVEEYKQQLINNDVNASNKLYDSVTLLPIKVNNNFYEVQISLEEYWKYVEKGRLPGKWPPISKIKEWIEIKPVLPRPMKNGKLPTTQQLAFLIARKIGLNGIKPRQLLQYSVEEIWKIMKEELETALALDVQNEIKTIMGKMRG